MAEKADLLGRAPVMRPLERAGRGSEPSRERVLQGDKMVVLVPYATTNSSVCSYRKVTVSAFPWDEGAA